MKPLQLKQLLKSLIKRQPNRFIQLMSAIQSESSPLMLSTDNPDALASFLANLISHDSVDSEADILNNLSELFPETEESTSSTTETHAFKDGLATTSGIRIPSDDQLRHMARKILQHRN